MKDEFISDNQFDQGNQGNQDNMPTIGHQGNIGNRGTVGDKGSVCRADIIFHRLIKLPEHLRSTIYCSLFGLVENRLTENDLDYLEESLRISEKYSR